MASHNEYTTKMRIMLGDDKYEEKSVCPAAGLTIKSNKIEIKEKLVI